MQDLAKLEASIDRFGKQIEAQKIEMLRWKSRISDRQADIKDLRIKITETVRICNIF